MSFPALSLRGRRMEGGGTFGHVRLGSHANQRMNTGMCHHLRFLLALNVCLLACINTVHAQPGPDRCTFYRTRIQHNADANEQLRAINELRRQLPDTADPVDTRQRHPTRLTGQKEALFLNFLCYVHEARISGQGTCGLQQGFRNYDRMVALGPVDGYPSAVEQQQALGEARNLERELCRRAFERNNSRLEGLPATACGCVPVLEALIQEGTEALRAHEAWEAKEEAQRAALRDAARRDSIVRVEQARKERLSMAIYAPNGRLRCDTTNRIRTTDIDGLNAALLDAMFHAARTVLQQGATTERDWELLAISVHKDRPSIWSIKALKQRNLFQLEDLTIGDFGSNV
ncbi:MAG: hypothetical protein JNM91_11615, partial [Flavobacteriales bacterium]|nr:hypothetical protein [Flavobacteriales bacterium]